MRIYYSLILGVLFNIFSFGETTTTTPAQTPASRGVEIWDKQLFEKPADNSKTTTTSPTTGIVRSLGDAPKYNGEQRAQAIEKCKHLIELEGMTSFRNCVKKAIDAMLGKTKASIEDTDMRQQRGLKKTPMLFNDGGLNLKSED